MSFPKAIDPDHDISDHHYYDNYTECSYTTAPIIAPLLLPSQLSTYSK